MTDAGEILINKLLIRYGLSSGNVASFWDADYPRPAFDGLTAREAWAAGKRDLVWWYVRDGYVRAEVDG